MLMQYNYGAKHLRCYTWRAGVDLERIGRRGASGRPHQTRPVVKVAGPLLESTGLWLAQLLVAQG
jgi:hypothetical protein